MTTSDAAGYHLAMLRTLLGAGLLIAIVLPSAHGGTAALDPSFDLIDAIRSGAP